MDFFINRNSTLPLLKLELIRDGRNDYKKFLDMIQNADIKFSMYDAKTGVKRISNKPGKCILKPSTCDDDEEEYFIAYEWKTKDTKKVGTFIGQFTITFLEDGSVLKVPIREELVIMIKDGTIKK